MIALGLAVELIAAGLLIVGVVLAEPRAATALWSSVVLALVGLAITAAGVQRARPPRRSVTPPLSSVSPVAGEGD